MKSVKFTLGMVILLAFLGFNEAMGQWAPDGPNIHNTNAANVAIGVFPATTLLQVGKNMVEPTISVRNFGGAGGATYQMSDLTSGANWKFKATGTGGFKIRDEAFAMDVINIAANSNANALNINNLGYVGIGTTTPAYQLHVVGNDIGLDESAPFVILNSTLAGSNAGINFKEIGRF